ncbi:MAG: UbiD family decarboxylase [Acidimicrobiales bacterium]
MVTAVSERQDFRVFLRQYEEDYPADVLRVEEELSADQDVTALVWRLASQGRAEILICPRVVGLGAQLVTNVFASRQRVARLLGTEVAGLHDAYQERARKALDVRVLDDGPVTDQVEQRSIDLATIPMIKHFETDRAPYITSGIICARHPATGVSNLSYHRAMIHSPSELATSLHSRGHLWRMLEACRASGAPLRAAMIIGAHPLFMLAASARVGPGVDERTIAGGLFGEALEVVPTPRYGIGVPATAEMVLEGVLDSEAVVEEGPFGEFTGYSSNRSTHTLFRVETVLRRREAVLIDVVGGNSAEHLNLARIPRESEMAEKLKERFPSVTAVHYPNSGTHFHCYVALRQTRPGEARQVMLGLLGWDPYLKTVVAVDADVDVADDASVLWALATHFQPAQDLFLVEGLPGSPLDPSSSTAGTTSRLALDATRSPSFEGTRIEITPRALGRAAEILRVATESAESR